MRQLMSFTVDMASRSVLDGVLPPIELPPILHESATQPRDRAPEMNGAPGEEVGRCAKGTRAHRWARPTSSGGARAHRWADGPHSMVAGADAAITDDPRPMAPVGSSMLLRDAARGARAWSGVDVPRPQRGGREKSWVRVCAHVPPTNSSSSLCSESDVPGSEGRMGAESSNELECGDGSGNSRMGGWAKLGDAFGPKRGRGGARAPPKPAWPPLGKDCEMGAPAPMCSPAREGG